MTDDLETKLLAGNRVDAGSLDEQDAPTNQQHYRSLDWGWLSFKRTRWLFVLMVSSTITLLAIVVGLVLYVQALHLSTGLCSSHRELEGLDASQADIAFFGKNLPYMSLDHKYDQLWDPELFHNNAVVDLPEQNGLKHVGVIAMFHQLHCLSSIRKALQKAREGEDIGIDQRDDHHWPHCFDYLRSGILCGAEDTIELPEKGFNNEGQHPISGAWDLRTCSNARALYDMRARYGRMDKPPQYSPVNQTRGER